MKVKMRDSEIQRLKRKDGITQEPSFDEVLKVEIDAVKQEFQSEVVKYKLAGEELERRLSVYEAPVERTGKENTLFTLWSTAREIDFQHDMATALTDMQSKNDDFQEHVDDMGKGMFLGYFGFTLDEAQTLKSQNTDLMAKYKELSITSEATKIALANSLSNASDLEGALMTIKGEFECKMCEFECEKLQLSATISCLTEEVSEKTKDISVLKGNIQRTDDELIKAQQAKEKELRDMHNTLMKENMILVQSSRELEVSVREKTTQLEQKSHVLANLEDKVTYVCTQMETAGRKHKESIGAIEVKLCDADRLIGTQKEAMREDEMRIGALEEANKSWSEEATLVSEQLEATSCDLLTTRLELEASVDTNDSLHSQAETLIANLDEEKTLHASSLEKVLPIYDIIKKRIKLFLHTDDICSSCNFFCHNLLCSSLLLYANFILVYVFVNVCVDFFA
jgi:hypothetical protein